MSTPLRTSSCRKSRRLSAATAAWLAASLLVGACSSSDSPSDDARVPSTAVTATGGSVPSGPSGPPSAPPGSSGTPDGADSPPPAESPDDGHDHNHPMEEPPGTEAPPPLPTQSVPEPAKVDARDPSTLGLATVVTMWSIDTAKDTSMRDGLVRASGFFSPSLYAKFRADPPGRGDAALWETWREHHAYTVVTATPVVDSGRPEDTTTTAQYGWSVQVQAFGTDGWRGPPDEFVVYLTLSRANVTLPWQVAEWDVQ